MPITFDESRWPIVVVRFSERPTTEEFSQYLTQLTRYLKGEEQIAYILDARNAPSPPTEHRRMQAEWMKNNKEQIKARVVGSALVFSSSLFRFVLSTIFLIQPLPVSYVVVASMEEAVDWCRQQLPKK